MAARDFFLDATRKRVANTVEEIEKQTAAEIVVAVRRRCGRYGVVDVSTAALLAFAALCAVVYLPQELNANKLPEDVGIAFWASFALTTTIAPLKRLLTPRSMMNANVRSAARAAFHDMRIARTRGRTGVLVFVSMFERKVEIVADIGVPVDSLGDGWRAAVAAMEAAGRRADLDALLAAMKTMAPPLAAALPVQPDDVDELPNEPEVA